MRIILASDHGGFKAKESIVKYLISKNITIEDKGCHTDESVDYPDFAHSLCSNMDDFDFGILICGSGQGMSITANKYNNIRAALCWTKEISQLSRQHNDANVLCIPGRFLSNDSIIEIVENFIYTNFEGGRHVDRVRKIQKH